MLHDIFFLFKSLFANGLLMSSDYESINSVGPTKILIFSGIRFFECRKNHFIRIITKKIYIYF